MKIDDPVRKSIEAKADKLRVKSRTGICGDCGKPIELSGNHWIHISIPSYNHIAWLELKGRKKRKTVKTTKPGASAKRYGPIEMDERDHDPEDHEDQKRDVATEETKVTTGKSSALSSKKCVYYHDIPPELFRRLALRCTGGHIKYNDKPVPITMNLNWRVGLDDPLYMMDRFNHLIEHLVCFLEDGNEHDDNLGAIALMAGWLMECEKHCPEVFQQLFGQQKYFGKKAEAKRKALQKL